MTSSNGLDLKITRPESAALPRQDAIITTGVSPVSNNVDAAGQIPQNEFLPPMVAPCQSGSECSSSKCKVDRIAGTADVLEAVKLTWIKQRSHLFVSWIHVPLGVITLLVLTWGLKLAMNLAPFRFPAPVIAMIIFFVVLLLLDYLSSKYPGKPLPDDTEKGEEEQKTLAKRKRFVDPFMKLLAPPCDFCLRNMSVMFTPSFVLIPAREVIPPKEIGLIAAWFTISQVLAFLFPVFLNWAIEWVTTALRQCCDRKSMRRTSSKTTMDPSRRNSTATLAGVDYEKGISFVGGYKLGAVATGLSGLTATVMAPITHIQLHLDDDERRQIEATAMEHARQQGDPAVTNRSGRLQWSDFKPISDVSSYHHPSPHHNHNSRPGLRGSRSKSRTRSSRTSKSPVPTAEAEYCFPSPETGGDRSHSSQDAQSLTPVVSQPTVAFEPELETAASFRTRENQKPDDVIEIMDEDRIATAVNSRRGSKVNFDVDTKEYVAPAPVTEQDSRRGSEAMQSVTSEDQPDAIERLSSWFSDLITPTIYFLLFLVGLPLYFLLDLALPLFLAINLLTFVAAITIVPPKIRRFLHPILSCSLATVFIIWAFAAMKGTGLKDCLNRFYSVDAKYDVLWSPSGYKGPVPGAGDILFSTLDAGIVALAVPMYRYRKELKENFFRMVTVLIPCAALSLFFWPFVAAKMGMDEIRSLAFAARFMSTPLAIELAGNVGADESITVILVVITGIIAAILKDHFFKLVRVHRDDHLMIGITMGSTAGAIGTSSLISTPRVMAVASLAFVIFGAILLIATAIPAIVDILQQLASSA